MPMPSTAASTVSCPVSCADNQPSYPYGLKRNSNASFIEDGKGYQIYNVEGEVETTVYYGGAYITLEEVAAYVYAFGELPANYIEEKSGNPKTSIWGEYLRLNYSRFNGRPNSYEPELPDITGCGGDTAYYEIDIGTTGTYTTPQYTPTIYNDGNKITRGAARIVFTVSVDGDPIDYPKDRRVFYTCNHYNDFREYLNYYNGWGKIFGNITAGGYFDQRQEPNHAFYAAEDEFGYIGYLPASTAMEFRLADGIETFSTKALNR